MALKILNQLKNPLLSRKEFLVELESTENPKEADILAELKTTLDTATVKRIISKFGSNIFQAEIHVYDSKEEKEKIQKLPRAQRKKQAEAKAQEPASQPAPAPVEEKKEEAPAEEKKEEVKAEEKSK